MKKFTALAFAVLFMMFVTSCGSDKKTGEKFPDSEVTDEDINEEQADDDTTETADDDATEPADDNNIEQADEDNSEATDEDTTEAADEDNTEPADEDNSEPADEDNTEPTDGDNAEPTDGDNAEPTDGDNAEAPTCDAEEHKELNAAGDACVCMGGYYDDGDDCIANPKCVQIPNGDFSDFDGINDAEGKNWQIDSLATYSNVDGALDVAISSQTGNGTAFDSAKFVTPSDSEVPAGIKFKLATIKSSKVAISFHWGTGSNSVFYAYNWDGNGNFVYDAKKPTTYNYDNPIDFGNTEMKEVTIIFGTEITEEIWHKTEDKFLRFKYGKNADYEIRVDDFEFVYYGGECNNAPSYTISSARTQKPETVEGYAGLSETFYGRVKIDGLTDVTLNKSVALMGVKAQFGVRAKDSDTVIAEEDWKDAAVNTENSDSGEEDEYKLSYTFPTAGDYEYMFRFSADNGQTWTISENKGIAKIIAPEAGKIPNGDFKYWLSDGKTPQLWTAKKAETSVWDRGKTNGYAVKITASEKLSTQKEVFVSPTFEIPSDKTATAIKFDMATDQAIAIQIGVKCGSSTLWYGWDSAEEHKYFSNSTTGYKVIDLGDSNTFYPTSIQLKASLSNVSCSLEFRVTSEAKGWAAFDNFEVVYED